MQLKQMFNCNINISYRILDNQCHIELLWRSFIENSRMSDITTHRYSPDT